MVEIDEIKPINVTTKKDVKLVFSCSITIIGGIREIAAIGTKGSIILTKYCLAGNELSCLRINTLTKRPIIASEIESKKVLYAGNPILNNTYVRINDAKNISEIAN